LNAATKWTFSITRITVATTGGLLDPFAKFLFAKLPVLLDHDTGKKKKKKKKTRVKYYC